MALVLRQRGICKQVVAPARHGAGPDDVATSDPVGSNGLVGVNLTAGSGTSIEAEDVRIASAQDVSKPVVEALV